jgi:hypothetical protein
MATAIDDEGIRRSQRQLDQPHRFVWCCAFMTSCYKIMTGVIQKKNSARRGEASCAMHRGRSMDRREIVARAAATGVASRRAALVTDCWLVLAVLFAVGFWPRWNAMR